MTAPPSWLVPEPRCRSDDRVGRSAVDHGGTVVDRARRRRAQSARACAAGDVAARDGVRVPERTTRRDAADRLRGRRHRRPTAVPEAAWPGQLQGPAEAGLRAAGVCAARLEHVLIGPSVVRRPSSAPQRLTVDRWTGARGTRQSPLHAWRATAGGATRRRRRRGRRRGVSARAGYASGPDGQPGAASTADPARRPVRLEPGSADAVAPSWYPDPQRDGMLRWWDGTRWTEHVQPARAAGKPVLGQEVTRRDRPGHRGTARTSQVTHAYPPITDDRYAGSPLASVLARARRGRAQRRGRAGAGGAPGGGRGRLPAPQEGRGARRGRRASASSCSSTRSPARARASQPRLRPGRMVVAYGAATAATWSPAGPAPEAGAGIVTPPVAGGAPVDASRTCAASAVEVASIAIRGAAASSGWWG